jgi:hypothetical protein
MEKFTQRIFCVDGSESPVSVLYLPAGARSIEVSKENTPPPAIQLCVSYVAPTERGPRRHQFRLIKNRENLRSGEQIAFTLDSGDESMYVAHSVGS